MHRLNRVAMVSQLVQRLRAITLRLRLAITFG